MVFGNNNNNITVQNTTSLELKRRLVLNNFEILRASIIAKYHVQVMLLVVYNRRGEIFNNAQETSISLRLKKTNTGACIRNNQWKKNYRQFFVKIRSPQWRQTTGTSSMKVFWISEPSLLRTFAKNRETHSSSSLASFSTMHCTKARHIHLERKKKFLFRVINDFSFIPAHCYSFDSTLFLMIDSDLASQSSLF